MTISQNYQTVLRALLYLFCIALFTQIAYFTASSVGQPLTESPIILKEQAYNDLSFDSLWHQLAHRIEMQPFNLVATIIFVLAIIHTFFAHQFSLLATKMRARNIRMNKPLVDSFGVEFLRFMGEIEVVFGLWVIPLIISMTFFYSWPISLHYLDNIRYTEPLFVVVIMALASTKPIMKLAEQTLSAAAQLGGCSVTAWWWTILSLAPLLGSLITEPAAMTIASLLLARQFYHLKPSKRLSYATLGLLFTNISVGGILTNFAAPPVLMASAKWHWDTPFMIATFGWKALFGILTANTLYFLIFRSEFKELNKHKIPELHDNTPAIPLGVSLMHVAFLIWIIVHIHYPILFLGTFLLFLGFHRATMPYQEPLELKTPILVGFFLAGLVVHGNLQGWWVSPLLERTSGEVLMVVSVILTAFNDNAEITFLATLIPSLSDEMKYMVVAGAVTGGGLTVIANAPNLAGQSLLNKYFRDGISAFYLFLGALVPTIIMALIFYFIRF